MNHEININPDPRILAAITHNPLKPINALCELIDNSVDGFKNASRNGIEIENPAIHISLPRLSDIEAGIGKLTVSDNGPGLSMEDAKGAVTAGFSGNKNPLDNLGLFGMGFNIATGKLGQRTIFTSTRSVDDEQVSINIDIPEMIKNNSFNVPFARKPKLNKDDSGTSITIDKWWTKGTMNFGFIEKLVRMGRPALREGIGRLYYPILNEGVKIFIDGEECPKYEHCVWSENRYVEHQKHGKIPAQFKINQSIGSEVRCNTCWQLLQSGEEDCKYCNNKKTARTIDKRITGWVGIQRFDGDRYGIDLIRNGRVIRTGEKEAFFTWEDANGERMLDYPVDGTFGRIIGEVHLDYVPVDYLKTDFQRTSPEWNESMKVLRGESSLRPKIAEANNEPENNSPIYLLFQGYRSVRDYGTKDMYMGYWDATAGKPARIDRETERQLYEKFKKAIPGYGIKDDEEWWKYVEAAEQRTLESVKTCENCGVQNPLSAEQCISCNFIFEGKNCIKCEELIVKSSVICPVCNTPQYGKVDEAWKCNSCGRSNPPLETKCRFCKLVRGAEDVFSIAFLKENSSKVEKLSIDSFSIPLPEDDHMSTIKVSTYYLKSPYIFKKGNMVIPVVIHIDSEIHIFIDPSHEALNSFQDRPEDFIAMELAKYIIDMNSGAKINASNMHLWSVSSLYYTIHKTIWRNRIELSPQDTKNNIDKFFQSVIGELPKLLMNEAEEIYDNFDKTEESLILSTMLMNGVSGRFEEYKKSGEYLKYIPETLLIKLVEKYPANFFDSNFWTDEYTRLSLPDESILAGVREEIVRRYRDCLNDILTYKSFRTPDMNYTQKVNQSLNIITANIVNVQ